jgi:hypothetical protein
LTAQLRCGSVVHVSEAQYQDIGRSVRPCISPDDPDRVIELLRGRVPVS